MKDTAIKLFGKKIALPENGWIPAASSEDSSGAEDGECCRDRNSAKSVYLGAKEVMRTGNEEQSDEEGKEATADKDLFEGEQQDDTDGEPLPESDHDNPKTPAIDEEENAIAKASNGESDQSDPNNSQQKTLKKPDKILPCPRCNSMETKFCYYNNYNINQPRHFCKNCQRYWTAGGTMRNVPVGAGRRKNKNSASHFCHVTIPEVLHGIQIDPTNGINHPNFKPNGTVLSFGPEAPFSESIASVLKLAERKSASNCRETMDDFSSGSSVTTSNSGAEGARRNGFVQEPIMRNLNGFSPQIPCLPGIPFPYPWNSTVAVPAFSPSGFPMPFYPPPPYWNCNVPGAWTVPWFPMTNSQLGKHTRDGELLKPRNLLEGKEAQQERNSSERCVLIPKTLRIDDPDEAAKSSIWATLGIRNVDDSASRGSLFNGLQPKGQKKNLTPETPQALRANPAAFSRSLSFQESS